MLLALVLAVGGGACRLSQDGVHPPNNRIFFPGGALIDPSGRWLYVVNTNSDLRYNAGTVAVLDLHAVRQDYTHDPLSSGDQWEACPPDPRYVPPAKVEDEANRIPRCCWDILDRNILNCDEQKYFRDTRKTTVRIGSFAAQPVVQTLPDEKGLPHRRMFVPVRGDASITMVDVKAGPETAALSCYGSYDDPGDPSANRGPCDPNWRVTQLADPTIKSPLDTQDSSDPVVHLPEEPYAMAIDEQSELLYVGHLNGGAISLVDLTIDQGYKPELLQIYPGLLSDGSSAQGITSLTIKSPGCFGSVYASSRYRAVVGAFVVYGLDGCPRAVDQPISTRGIAIVGTGETLSTGLGGSETRGIAFVRPGGADAAGGNPDRMFILQRVPPAIVALDAATQTPFSVTEVCQGPTNLTQQRDATGRTVALFVTCFDAGEVYVIDPWVPRVRNVITIGRGPISTLLPPAGVTDPVDANRAYVVAFGGNNIAVIDLAEGPTQYHVIQRIGFTSATPREVGPQ